MSAIIIGDWAVGVIAESTLNDNIVAFWKLDEASGTRIDEVGSNDLTDNSTVVQAAGKIGNAAQFIAANSEYLSVADNTDLSTGDIDFTFAGWVYFDDVTGNQGVLSKDQNSIRDYRLDINASRLRWFVFDASANVAGTVTANSIGDLLVNTWYFVVCGHSSVSNQVFIQVNNGTEDIAATTGTPGDSAAEFWLGGFGSAAFHLSGRLDAWGLWKRVLTVGERTELYNSGNGKEYPF